MLKVLYNFFRSIKLASILIVYLIGLTIVIGVRGPEVLSLQRGVESLHTLTDGSAGAGAVEGGSRLGISLVVVVLPVVLFAINLVVCALSRVVGRIKAGSYFRRFGWLKTGPDLVHLSILLFLIGGLLSYYGRIEGQVTLQPGQIVVLNPTYMIRLEDFQIKYHPDGQPRQYISSIFLLKNSSQKQGHELIDRAEISVNNPYSMGRLKIYQSSFIMDESLGSTAGSNSTDAPPTTTAKAKTTGAKTGASVLKAVYDPGYPAIIIGILFFLLGLGFILTDKIRKNP